MAERVEVILGNSIAGDRLVPSIIVGPCHWLKASNLNKLSLNTLASNIIQFVCNSIFMDRNDLTTPFPLPPPHYIEFHDGHNHEPPKPIIGDFTVFGQIDNINFEPKLPPTIDKLEFNLPRKEQLKEINKRLKLKFIELLRSLSTDTRVSLLIGNHYSD